MHEPDAITLVFFGGRCPEEESKSTSERPRKADLGQEEAELEKIGKDQMSPKKRGPRR
jgi:hypothetical protein